MENKEKMQKMDGMSYKKFSLMMLISFIIMYGVMFLNVEKANHIYISTTRTYMALLMVSPMAIVMMLMMGQIDPNKKLNTGIMIGAFVLFALVLAFFLSINFKYYYSKTL